MNLSVPIMRRFADSDDPTSFANRLRARRFRRFEALTTRLPRPLRILDVGGTNAFWKNRGWHLRTDVEILTLNLVPEEQLYANVKPLTGDATNLAQFGERSVDVIFSNSVIEHLFTFENQRQMASEIQRVGKAFWIQTPNFWFPMEPHFHVPGWQWLPLESRVSMLQRRACGWRGPCPDPIEARRLVEEVRLLTRSELKALFPTARIVAERFCGLVKSWIAIGGFANR
jgi:hypothetical protein